MSSPKSRTASITGSGWSSRICSRNRAVGGVARVSDQKAMTGGALATFEALRQGSSENSAVNRVSDPCAPRFCRGVRLFCGSVLCP